MVNKKENNNNFNEKNKKNAKKRKQLNIFVINKIIFVKRLLINEIKNNSNFEIFLNNCNLSLFINQSLKINGIKKNSHEFLNLIY